MLRVFRKWLTDRKQRKLAKYAEERGWLDEAELDGLRRQHSPLRGRGSGSSR